jgi:hypothetical protein
MASRYERSAAAAARSGSEETDEAAAATPPRASDAWAALDRGEDPTLAPGERPDPRHLPE